ncbi:Hypothetical protein CINCED_3A001879 [Cinara cedri]|uniref:Uncharacterized protein n=1 Tax=Cinara cedri TaxID=506608 RepID=A0A5E4NIK8_9HEMI|nr:Hypothetical protein CINCED_3A001879 [Cinara cedri]
MESKLHQQQNAKMISLAKPKHSVSLAEKHKTWSNLLNKKAVGTNTIVPSKIKIKKDSSGFDGKTKTMSKSVQCDPFNNKLCSTNSLSVFNPIRTLQFLLKEIKELPNAKSITHIIDEMQVVVERITEEFNVNLHYSKLTKLPCLVENENSMIPTKENDYHRNEQNQFENKYWFVLLGKITELENNYSQLTNNYTKSEEKLLSVTSERDKLLKQFKESCNSLEMLNNREREYLDTIKDLKSKLIASDKLISKQEAIIINLNKSLNDLAVKNQELMNGNISNEQYKTILEENNDARSNCCVTKTNQITNDLKDNKTLKPRTDTKQMKKGVLAGLEKTNNHTVSISENNTIKDLFKYCEDHKNNIEYDIDRQYTNYNRQALAIKLAKTELQQLFETIKMQAILSKKLFSSTIVDENERNLSDMSDEDENHSNVSNFMSIVTNSSC